MDIVEPKIYKEIDCTELPLLHNISEVEYILIEGKDEFIKRQLEIQDNEYDIFVIILSVNEFNYLIKNNLIGQPIDRLIVYVYLEKDTYIKNIIPYPKNFHINISVNKDSLNLMLNNKIINPEKLWSRLSVVKS